MNNPRSASQYKPTILWHNILENHTLCRSKVGLRCKNRISQMYLDVGLEHHTSKFLTHWADGVSYFSQFYALIKDDNFSISVFCLKNLELADWIHNAVKVKINFNLWGVLEVNFPILSFFFCHMTESLRSLPTPGKGQDQKGINLGPQIASVPRLSWLKNES